MEPSRMPQHRGRIVSDWRDNYTVACLSGDHVYGMRAAYPDHYSPDTGCSGWIDGQGSDSLYRCECSCHTDFCEDCGQIHNHEPGACPAGAVTQEGK